MDNRKTTNIGDTLTATFQVSFLLCTDSLLSDVNALAVSWKQPPFAKSDIQSVEIRGATSCDMHVVITMNNETKWYVSVGEEREVCHLLNAVSIS